VSRDMAQTTDSLPFPCGQPAAPTAMGPKGQRVQLMVGPDGDLLDQVADHQRPVLQRQVGFAQPAVPTAPSRTAAAPRFTTSARHRCHPGRCCWSRGNIS
jgi:hypothetical protein